MNVAATPAELRELPQWACFRFEQRPGNSKPTKVPYRADDRGKAAVDRPASWTTFEQARAAVEHGRMDGVLFVLTGGDPYTVIDCDDCIGDDGVVHPDVRAILFDLDSYAEVSPSGQGVHVFVRGSLDGFPRHKTSKTSYGGAFENYDNGRFVTVTGELVRHCRGTIEDRQRQLDKVLRWIYGDPAPPPPPRSPQPLGLDDQELLERMFSARNGEKVRRLYYGDTSGYDSASEADLALCNHLAFYTGCDPEQMDRMFRASGLYRDKWDERRGDSTWGAQRIETAIEFTTEVYTPSGTNGHRPEHDEADRLIREWAPGEEPPGEEQPGEDGQESSGSTSSKSRRRANEKPLDWDWLTAFATRRVVWLDRPLWQADAFHLIVGRKGVGKGTTLADLAARVNRGEMGPKRRVLWIGSEDSITHDVKPRVLAAGGDPDQIAVVKDWLQLPRDLPRLRATIEAVGDDVGLLVIDPVSNHITGKNSNADTDVRDAIAPLNALADEYGLVVAGVRHVTEKEIKSGGVLAAILGASAWVQVPRAVIALARDPSDDSVHMQAVAGNRMPRGAPGRRFRIEAATVETDDGPGEVSRVVWEGESSADVEQLLTGRAAGPEPEPSRSEEARALILATLWAAPGQRMNAEVFDALIAEQAGISAKTVQNLRSELGSKGRGWLKAIPVKDEFGEVLRWDVGLTAAAPEPDPEPGPGAPDPDPTHTEPGSGLF